MEKEFIIKGFWWLPNNPGDQKPGILTYHPGDTIYLDLFDEFSTKSDNQPLRVYDLILGYSSSGKIYTLVDSFVTHQKYSMPGFPETKLVINSIYEGIHFNDKSQIKFHTLKTSFSYLVDWVWINGFSIDVNSEEKVTKITYKLPEEISCKINDSLTIKISFVAKNPSQNIVQKEASITQGVDFYIVSSTEIDFYELLKYQYQLSNLLSLAIGNPVKTLHLFGLTEKSIRKIDEYSYIEPVSIYFNQTVFSRDNPDINPWNMLFSFPQIKDRLQNILTKWLGEFDKLEDIFGLYFYTISAYKIAIQTKVLNYAEAIEAFHRKVIGGNYLDKETYTSELYPIITRSIPGKLNESFRESLKSKIKYGYEYSLRKRLSDLFSTYNNGIVNQIIGEKSSQLINEIVETRNYYTHYDEKTPNVCEGKRLLRLSNNLESIVVIAFLSFLEFSDIEIKSIIDTNYRLKQMIVIN